MADDRPEAPGRLQRVLGTLCHHCPVCAYGRRHPDSALGRVLRHPWHADRCPFWKAEQEQYPSGAGGSESPGA
jgi:hypothetical protein